MLSACIWRNHMNRPAATAGLRHVALFTNNLEDCETFYVELLGMQVEWRPDSDNVYPLIS